MTPVNPRGQSPGQLLAAALTADPARPLITFYDDATGERVELSAATLDNWVAKTANLFQDGLGTSTGQRVAVLLPAHWQTAAVLLGAWSAGLLVALGGDPTGADVVVAGPDRLADAARAGARETVGLSLRPLAGRLVDPPPGVLDFAAEAPAYGDRFTPWAPVPFDAPALELGIGRWTGAELVEAARAAAERWELPPGARVLSAAAYDDFDGLLAGLLAPLAVGGSIVLCRHLGELTDAGALGRRITAERVTAVVGADPGGTGARRLR